MNNTEANNLKQYTLPEILATALYASRIKDRGAALDFSLSTLQKLKEARDE
jgi:hypothetical protein